MRSLSSRPRLSAVHLLGAAAFVSVAVAIVLILTSSGTSKRVVASSSRSPVSLASGGTPHPHAVNTGLPTTRTQPPPRPAAPRLGIAKSLGQLIVARFAGTVPSSSMLSAIKAGRVGGIILFSDNTAGGVAGTAALVSQLQAAARQGGNPGLLIMTDQEGGLVKRLPGPPDESASQMSNPAVAAQQGAATASLLRSAGVNVDLAPVADVSDVDGFMTQEDRTFGSNPAVVARAACAFADALSAGGVAYTLKHFPGLGDAYSSTDNEPVSVPASRRLLYTDEGAYRQCGGGNLALVMVSSASYPNLTGSTPAVLSPAAYAALHADGVDPVTISDDFQAPGLAGQTSPALRAINAGLDLVMYAETEAASASAYAELYQDAQDGALSAGRIRAAAAKVLALKRSLQLG